MVAKRLFGTPEGFLAQPLCLLYRALRSPCLLQGALLLQGGGSYFVRHQYCFEPLILRTPGFAKFMRAHRTCATT
jgi:hypothetical protein